MVILCSVIELQWHENVADYSTTLVHLYTNWKNVNYIFDTECSEKCSCQYDIFIAAPKEVIFIEYR